jgi:hypothetical protein
MTLENYVKLESNIEKRLRVKRGSFRTEPRIVKDPKTNDPKSVNAAVMDVIEEDGKPVSKAFSTLSSKLADALKAAHDNGTLYIYNVGIKKVGTGYATEYQFRLY